MVEGTGRTFERPGGNYVDGSLLGRSILVVDDDPATLGMLKRELSKVGMWPVEVAATALEARQKLAARRRDFALIDYLLPNPLVLDLAAEVKAAHPSTRVVLMTGLEPEQLAKEGALPKVVQHCDRFIAKPFHIEDLIRLLAELTRGHDAPVPYAAPSKTSSDLVMAGVAHAPAPLQSSATSSLRSSPELGEQIATWERWCRHDGAWVSAGDFHVHHNYERALLNWELLPFSPALRKLLTYLLLSSYEPVSLRQAAWILRDDSGVPASQSVVYRRIHELRKLLDERAKVNGGPSARDYLVNASGFYVFQPTGVSAVDTSETPVSPDVGPTLREHLAPLPPDEDLRAAESDAEQPRPNG